jgi:ubiquinone/menaquinone biosynthesis C-methylase UbiE
MEPIGQTSHAVDAPTTESAAQALFAAKTEPSPFVRWHLSRKFLVMESLFRRYLFPGAKFVDMACGTGDGLVLASMCQSGCEIWGLDIDSNSLHQAARRAPGARLVEGDMVHPQLPKGYFDVVHEFGATFFIKRWDLLAKAYLALLRDGGILLWELPQQWSTAHVSYLFSLAPRITPSDTRVVRVLCSLSPWKYTYESDRGVMRALQHAGCDFEVLERVPIWYFYCRGLVCRAVDLICKGNGDRILDRLDRLTKRVWPRYSGYYLVVRKRSASGI